MKRKFWTYKELEFIKNNIDLKPIDEIACSLGRTVSSVQHKMSRDNISHPKIWTESDKQFLIGNYRKLKNKDIAKILNRSISGIETAAKKLDVNSHNFFPPDKYCEDCGAKFNCKYTKATVCAICAGKKIRGVNNPMWNGGVKSLDSYISSYLRPWKKKVLKRDNNTCQVCDNIENLEVHHRRTFKSIREAVTEKNPQLDIRKYEDRRELSKKVVRNHKLKDGVTLCYSCHKKIHYEKLGELLGPPNERDEGNQQPSTSNVIDLVGVKVQRLTGEESQPIIPTRAPNTALL